MYSLRKSKKGFTLIELMVVVAIIGVLALLGLRLYAGQQEKAKNSIVKANAGTIQTLIQAELADNEVTVYDESSERDAIFVAAGIYNPVTGSAQIEDKTAAEAAEGEVWTSYSNNVFSINGKEAGSVVGDTQNVYSTSLTARK